MKTTTVPFELRSWRYRMRWTQEHAAERLGLSVDAYRKAEYRNEDRDGYPCQKTLALLAAALEREELV